MCDYEIKLFEDAYEKDITEWTNLELVENFKTSKYYEEELKKYLSSKNEAYDEYYNYDKDKNRDKDKKLVHVKILNNRNKFNLECLTSELARRINETGKAVDFYDKYNNVINSFIIPKSNIDDVMAFVICNKNVSYAVHREMYNLCLKEDIEKLEYKIDRKVDNSVNWKHYFPKYDRVGFVINERLVVYYKGKCGFVDEKGLPITPIKYDEVWPFSGNLTRVRTETGGWAILNKKGEELTDFKYTGIVFIDYFKYTDNQPVIVFNSMHKFGLIDQNDNIIMPMEYNWISHFYEDKLKVKIDKKFYIYNTKGERLIDIAFERITPLDEEKGIDPPLYIVYADDKYGLMDKDLNFIIPIECDFIMYRSYNNTLSVTLNEEHLYYDLQGNLINN